MTTNPVLQFTLALAPAEAEARVREALQQQGFGILTEVDIAATLRAKLGIETPPHRILGACNPRLAHASIQAEPSVAAFLPCGLALRQGDVPNETIIAIQDPLLLAGAFEAPALAPVAEEVSTLLRAAMASIGARPC
ncbi:MAG: DUF302 domain-containing protein [Dehalococcoidia bacterium]